MKIPIIIRRKYVMYVEPLDFGLVIHVDVLTRWTKSLRAEMLETFEAFLKLYGKPVYAAHYDYQGETHIHWLLMFGFEPFGTAKDGRGQDCILLRTHPPLVLP